MKEVSKAKNVVVFLSVNYCKSAFCLVELCAAIHSGANIVSVLVVKPGLEAFDFKKMHDLLELRPPKGGTPARGLFEFLVMIRCHLISKEYR